MRKNTSSLINIDALCQLQGPVQIFLVDLKCTILNCNDTELNTLEEVFSVDKKNIVGSNGEDILRIRCSDSVINTIREENEMVIKTRTVQQFHNIWCAKDLYSLELLTIKIPTYTNSGKLAGILGVSYYLNKFSFNKSSKLGLSNREIECLFYILAGKTNKQITGLLDISVRTVEGYLESIKRKLGCFNKSSIFSKARQFHLIEGINNGINVNSTSNNTSDLVLLSKELLFSTIKPLIKIPHQINFTTAESLLENKPVLLYKL